jgi:Family of unknown function (DUF6191)
MTQWGLDTLFNPAKRHMDEEKRRLQSTREQLGDSSGGKRIDLESGKVKISKGTRAEDEDEENPDADAATPTADENADEAGSTAKPGRRHERPLKPAPSPAAVRAAQRRGRQPR